MNGLKWLWVWKERTNSYAWSIWIRWLSFRRCVPLTNRQPLWLDNYWDTNQSWTTAHCPLTAHWAGLAPDWVIFSLYILGCYVIDQNEVNILTNRSRYPSLRAASNSAQWRTLPFRVPSVLLLATCDVTVTSGWSSKRVCNTPVDWRAKCLKSCNNSWYENTIRSKN